MRLVPSKLTKPNCRRRWRGESKLCDPKRAEACDVPTTASLQSNYNRELSYTSITRTQLPSYNNYRTDLGLTSKKINSPSPPLLVLINSSLFQQLGTQATNRL
jgi:hypothetical protein